jgi:hypothetical protein
MEIKTFRQIYRDMINYIISHQKKITDFNDGGGLTSQLEAWARELGELYRRCRVGFSTFLRSLPYSIFGFELKAGVKATTMVKFNRGRPLAQESPIPANTIVAAGNLQYVTVGPCVVPNGEIFSQEVEAIATEIGEKYNVDAGAIKTKVTTLSSDIVGVTNTQPATGGKSTESWLDYVARFAQYILGLQRTNGAGFRMALTSGYVVRSMSIAEHFPPIDKTWNVTVYLEDGTGDMPELGIELIRRVINGDGSPKNGGYRAPGINVRYLPPEKVFISPTIIAVTKQDVTNEIDESVVIEEVTKKTKEYINSLKIGQKYVVSDLIVILKRITYLDDVRIEGNNVEISKNQIIRFLNCIVKVEVGQ